MRLRIAGVDIELDPADEAVRAYAAELWEACLAPESDRSAKARSPRGAKRSGRRVPLPPPVGYGAADDVTDHRVATQVTLAVLAATAGERLNLHAAGLSNADGRVLALVGPSGTGKTTAVRALGSRLRYVSDETVSIATDGGVAAYAKPISVVVPGSPSKVTLPPGRVGLTPAVGELHLAAVVWLQREREETAASAAADRPAGLRRLDVAQALINLVPQTSSLLTWERPLLALADALQRVGGVWQLTYREIAEHSDELVALLADPPTWQEPIEHLPGMEPRPPEHATAGASAAPVGVGMVADPLGADGRVVRAVWRDAIRAEGATVVLREGTAYLLEGLGETLWLTAEEPATLAKLAGRAEELHGAHPDATDLIAQGVAELCRAGLLAVVD